MEASIITSVIAPLTIAFIMFGMGLSLTKHDFKRVWLHPKAISIGIILQIVGLPILGFSFVSVLELEPILAVSVMLLSSCPGGAITNLVSFISKGDAALSVSLTAVNSFITVVTIPVLVTFFLGHFLGKETAAQVNILKLSLGIILITIPPIIFGMITKQKAPELAKKSESWVRKGTIIFLVILASIASYGERQMFLDNYQKFALIAVSLCMLSGLMGTIVGSIARLPRKQILTLAIEVGLPNSGMGIVIALSFLDIKALAVFSAFYLVVEYGLSGILMVTMNSRIGTKIMGQTSQVTHQL
ncbi:hypothetical protein KJ966_19700 [bacterium]|nr:hypothetical protein [bacterium]